MTKQEYNKIKNIEANKWLGTISFITAITCLIVTIIKLIEGEFIWWSIACSIVWAIAGVIRIIHYNKDIKYITFDEA